MPVKKLGLSFVLIAAGVLLWLQRMTVVHATVGKFRVRLGQLFGVDRLYYYVWSIKIGAIVLILCGLALVVMCLKNRTDQQDQAQP
jgi:hypothetical protein